MIVNLCGFGWSGSGAYIDLLREYEDISLPNAKTWEFNFLWAPDGLYDLEQKICIKHCRIFDSFLAIERFLEIAKIYGKKNGVFKYDRYLSSPFYNQCKLYIDKLVQFHLEANCFVHKLHPTLKDRIIMFYNRWLGHFLYNRFLREKVLFKNIFFKLKLDNYKVMNVSYKPDNFLKETQDFVASILDQIRPNKNKILLLDQSVPPDMPDLFDHFFKESQKTIVIRRDPRDQFITINELKGTGRPVPTNVNDFILFYRKTIAETRLPDSEKLLSLNFEDLIYNYDATVEIIENYLGLTSHVYAKKYFDPAKSINNTQLINLYPKYTEDIKKIEAELSDCLYHYNESYKRTTNYIF